MPTITCTPAGSSDNCYVTELQANAYFADTLKDGRWRNWSDLDRQRALIQATNEIEDLGGALTTTTSQRARFRGAPSNTTQALHFPRSTDGDSTGAYVVPQMVREAVIEQAHALLMKRDEPEPVDIDGLRQQGVSDLSSDGLSMRWSHHRRPPHVCPEAWRRIQPYIILYGRTVTR